MSQPTYRRAENNDVDRPLKECGPVLSFGKPGEGGCVVFLCPCGGREVYVTSPPHTIEWDDAGRLSLDGSVGSKELSGPHEFRIVHGESLHDLPANWCHFKVKVGVATMYDDAKCPGSATQEPAGS